MPIKPTVQEYHVALINLASRGFHSSGCTYWTPPNNTEANGVGLDDPRSNARDESRCSCGYAKARNVVAAGAGLLTQAGFVSPKPRDELAWFAGQMEETLRRNDGKRGWHRLSLRWLLNRCRQELGELERAIDDTRVSVPELIREATDVANFAMMIADNAKEGRTRQ